MDKAWELERSFWEEMTAGHAGAFYARHMTADGYTVFPHGVIERSDLIDRWNSHDPLKEYELSEPRLLLVDGGSVLIQYHVTAHGEWLRGYRAWVSALYTWEGDNWALVMRQHTPEAGSAF